MQMSGLAKYPPDRPNQCSTHRKKADPSLIINSLAQIVCKISGHFMRSCQHKEPEIGMPNLLKEDRKGQRAAVGLIKQSNMA